MRIKMRGLKDDFERKETIPGMISLSMGLPVLMKSSH
jgi:hypothetical protein